MDSINRQQPENTRADLAGTDAIAKIKELVASAKSCFFCTTIAMAGSTGVRPMSVLRVDDDGNLWFLSAIDSHKNTEIALDSDVKLFFQGSAHSDFLVITGRASITTDKAVIAGLWSPILRTWFTEGLDDPRVTAIKVTPAHGHYWDTKHGSAIAGMKMLVGAALGVTLDDSIEGEVTVRPSSAA
jgi:general stress protein 26